VDAANQLAIAALRSELSGTAVAAKPVSSYIAAFGMTFENQAGSAFSAPFRWQA
jgi:hypothetical protein